MDFLFCKIFYEFYFWKHYLLFQRKPYLTISLNHSTFSKYFYICFYKWKKIFCFDGFDLMWQMSWAVVNYFDIICSLLVLKSKWNIKVFSFLCFLYILIWIFTIDWWNIFSAIPIINGVLTTYLLFYFSGVKLKIWLCVLLVAWLIYSVSTHSIWSVISDFLLLISWIIWAVKIKREEILLKKKNWQFN